MSDSLFEGANPIDGFPVLEVLSQSTNSVKDFVFEVARYLDAEADLGATIYTWFEMLDDGTRKVLIDRSAERPTHYKWYFGGDRTKYLVYLHQYKQPDEYQRSYKWAAAVHDHRYAFASRALSGALSTNWYKRVSDVQVELERQSLQGANDVVTVQPDDVHAIAAVAPNTITLVIQSWDVSTTSTVYDMDTLTARTIEPFDLMLGVAMQRLSPSADVLP